MINSLVIPTYDVKTKLSSSREFDSQEDFTKYVLGIFKKPGEYHFTEDVKKAVLQYADLFNSQGFYCSHPFKSIDFIDFWDRVKHIILDGIIIIDGKNEFYFEGAYFLWLNFLPILDKVKKKFQFPSLWDSQYHMALYEILAELHGKHAVVFKKRQFGSSYFHMAKVIRLVWFTEGSVCKIGASLKRYINSEGSWKFLNEYKVFLNENTAFYRPLSPEKDMLWQQKIKVKVDGRETERGNKSMAQGLSFEKDPETGVGGLCSLFFYEEAGIAPTMDITFEYLKPALQLGSITTGLFVAAGSVGELDDCKPLKKFLLNPFENDFFGVETNLVDETGITKVCGLFIPEQWSMPPYIDDFGNSLVEEALEFIKEERKDWQKTLDPDIYQLRVSQKPTNIAEGFKTRKESIFSVKHLILQRRNIEEGLYHYKTVDIERTLKNELVLKTVKKSPILDFPVSKKLEDKRGVIQMWEEAKSNPQFGEYYASIDPVGEGSTVTSNSLCSIFVYKNSCQIKKEFPDGTSEIYIEPGKIVCSWCGRFDTLEETHKRLENIIEYYNARTLIENNISHFINYMIGKRKQRYLVPKNDMLFLKELNPNTNQSQEYGWRNVSNMFHEKMISYAASFIKEVVDIEYNEDGTEKRKTYGIERIPDIMLITELEQYEKGLNVDRVISFTALCCYINIQNTNLSLPTRTLETENLNKTKKITKLNKRAFTNMGGTRKGSSKKTRSPWRNFK